MKLYLRLAWRNVWRHRRRTIIILLAIGLGLALMMFYDGMVAGFEQAIYGNAIQVLGGNIQIHAAGYHKAAGQTPLLPLANDQAVVQAALAHPDVQAAARRIHTSGLASSREGAFAVGIVGIEPDRERSISLLAQRVVEGRFLNADDRDAVLIGHGLARAMGVTVGDRFTLAGRAVHDQVRRRTMTVIGIYDVGLPDLEKRTVYLSLAAAQDLYGLSGQSTEIAVTLRQIGDETAVIDALRRALTDGGVANYEFDTWASSFPEMAQAINAKGGVTTVFGVIITIIAAIGIVNMLLMAVYERTREIGILGAMGLKPRQISLLFVLEGGLIAGVGVVVGIVLGVLMNGALGIVGIDYSSFTSLTEYTALISGTVYPTLGLDNLLQRSVTVIVIAVLASLYPAREAAHSEPAKALHYV
ncbi:MAG: FtsX-like permease family protein [Anaerolineae bacterium]|nr:ABC transporter permease [Thermoflexales bacterium]MDW8407961.1 FtsX-like permease family protein [Anaerolineae bacterium]